MAAKLLNLLAISSLAILACSFGPTPVNAVSLDTSHNFARQPLRGHDAIAKRKRSNLAKRCKTRPASSQAPPPTTSTTPAKTSSAAPKPTSTKPASPSTTSNAAAPPKTTSSSPAPPSGGNSGGGSGGGKVGLAWPNGDDASLKNYKTSKVSPLYTWSPEYPTQAKALGFNPIPMLWGENQVDDFKRLVVKGYANTVLGFNEPDQKGQSNLTPQRAAQLWKQYIDPLKNEGYALISPAVTSAPAGKVWMKDFFAACDGCQFDGLALHWYDIKASDFIAYITDFHNTFNLPIHVTEFACQNFNGGPQATLDQIFSFMSTVTKFMDETDWVVHYYAFGVMHDMQNVNPLNQLMGPNGSPTDLGYLFINA